MEGRPSVSERSSRISRLLHSRESRTAYIKAKLGVLVPAQIRALRLKRDMPRQKDLARAAGMQQSRISLIETPGAANITLETLSKLGATFGTGVVVKFVPFSEMLRWENSFSPDAFDAIRIELDEAFLAPAGMTASTVESAVPHYGAATVGSAPIESETPRKPQVRQGAASPMAAGQYMAVGR